MFVRYSSLWIFTRAEIIGAGIAALALSAIAALTLWGFLRWLRGEEPAGPKLADLTLAWSLRLLTISSPLLQPLWSYLSRTARRSFPRMCRCLSHGIVATGVLSHAAMSHYIPSWTRRLVIGVSKDRTAPCSRQ